MERDFNASLLGIAILIEAYIRLLKYEGVVSCLFSWIDMSISRRFAIGPECVKTLGGNF